MTIYNRAEGSRVSYRRLLWVGPLTIIAATVANIAVQQIAAAILRPDPQFVPLTLGGVAAFSAQGVLAAVIAYAIVGRLSRDPIPLYRRIALIVLALSFIPDIALLFVDLFPGTTLPSVIALMLMHIVAWIITVEMLTRLASE